MDNRIFGMPTRDAQGIARLLATLVGNMPTKEARKHRGLLKRFAESVGSNSLKRVVNLIPDYRVSKP